MKPKSTDRRSFLKKSAFAVAAPLILPSGILSAATKPNDRINVGFIGMGKQSGGLLNNFMRDDSVRVLAVAEVDRNRRDDAKQKVDRKYGNTECADYNDFRELVGRSDIDAVCIATPDHWHAYQTIASLDSGKDVYCEKPLTHNIHESIAVMKAVERNGRILQTGSMQRSYRIFRVACELVRNGVIGDVTRGAVNFGPPGVPCDLPEEDMEPGLDWDMWLGPGPLRPFNSILSPRGVHKHFPSWRKYKEYGGGMVCDWGAHHLDIIQWGLNKDESGPIAAVPPAEHDGMKGAQLIYDGGITVAHGQGIGAHFFGTEGDVQVSRGEFAISRKGKKLAGNLGHKDGRKALNAELDKAEDLFLKNKKVHLYESSNHIVDFIECMRSRKKPNTHEGIGARSAIACHLMNQSYYHRQSLLWDPIRLKFKKGSGHPSWMTREYRGSWVVA